VTRTLTRAAGRVAEIFRPSQRQIPVKAIADAAYKRGFTEGWAAAAELFGVEPVTAMQKAAAG
jgi:hypothetical protein